ncbi:MAG: GNAT family N-acetyltransferase [Novosphingobium sp.]
MFIRSERLFLRPGWPEDAEEMEALLADNDVARQLAAPASHAAGDCAGEWLGASREPLLPRFCISLPTGLGAKLVGWIGLGRVSGEVSLACWIGRSFRGQGYASEASRAVLSLARALGHHRITAERFADDSASERFLSRLGFKPDGEPRVRLSWARGGEALAITHALVLEPWRLWALSCGTSCNDLGGNGPVPARPTAA